MAEPPIPSPPTSAPARSTAALAALAGAGGFLALVLMLSMFGLAPGQPPLVGMFAGASVLAGALPLAAAYFLAGIGIGRPIAWVLARGKNEGRTVSRAWIQVGLGSGTMLWLSHLSGMLDLGRMLAWPLVLLGLGLLLEQVVRAARAPDADWSRWARGGGKAVLVWTLPLAIMAIAACNPPGALWRSEFGGYDALSYHLQLAKEWSTNGGPIRPAAHNVYSYLPSYMESAYAHLAWLTIPSGTGNESAARALLGVGGWWAYACQMLHAMYGLAAAALVGRFVFRVAEGLGVSRPAAVAGGVVAGAVLLATPWTIVVGSLGYNELAVLAMTAAGMLIAIEDHLPVVVRGAACGWASGLACSAKPTALLLACPIIGVLLVMRLVRAPGGLAKGVGAGAMMGLLAMAPWLVRNMIASGGNPVFPMATGVFGGQGRGVSLWTAEQIGRYARNHTFDGSIVDRLGMLFGERGFGHTQWALVPVLGAIALGYLLSRRRSHIMGAVLSSGLLAGVGAWMAFTHLQSRFLLPVLPVLAAAIGLAGSLLMPATGDAKVSAPRVAALLTALPVVLSAHTFRIFSGELGGRPNAMLVTGVPGLSGDLWLGQFKGRPREELLKHLMTEASPAEYLNAMMIPEGRVYLLGDATPLYMFSANGNPVHAMIKSAVFYHTTWDRSLLGEAIRAAPDDPQAWSRWFEGRGIDYVLVNYSELTRLIDKDHYYDPEVTTARVQAWLGTPGTGLKSIRQWTRTVSLPDGRSAEVPVSGLFRIDPPRDAGGGRP